MFKKLWRRHKIKHMDLRGECIKEYGEEFAEIYDNMNRGIPVGNLLETMGFVEMIEDVKRRLIEEIDLEEPFSFKSLFKVTSKNRNS